MSDTTEQAAPRPQSMTVKVQLAVTHRVTVRVSGDSSMTIEDLKALALEEFHRDLRGGPGRRNEDTWRAQFINRSNLSVGDEQVLVSQIESSPQSSGAVSTW